MSQEVAGCNVIGGVFLSCRMSPGSMSLTGPLVAQRGVAGCDFTGGVSYVVSLGRRLRRFSLCSGVFCRVLGRRQA